MFAFHLPSLSEQLSDFASLMVGQLQQVILKTPLIFNDTPQLKKLWYLMFLIAIILLAFYIASHGIFSISNSMLGRVAGSDHYLITVLLNFIFASFSLKIMGILIKISNQLVSTIADNIKWATLANVNQFNFGGFAVFILSLILVVLDLALVLYYYWRNVYIAFLGVVAPLCFLAPNEQLAYTWFRETVLAIILPFIHMIILAVGSSLVIGKTTVGSIGSNIEGIFYSIATVFFMLSAPGFLHSFIPGFLNPYPLARKILISYGLPPMRRFVKK